MKKSGLNVGQRLLLELLWGASRLFAILPYWFKFYVVQPVVYFLIACVARYRRKVVDTNLRNSFPEKSDRERAAIRRGFYNTLAEAVVCTMNMAGIRAKKVRRYVFVRDYEEHRRNVAGKDWVAMAAHYGCWEYCIYWGVYDNSQQTISVYHRLKSSVMEQFYHRLRSFEYSQPVPAKESMRFFLRNREKGIKGRRLIMGLIADQNPKKRPDSHWFRFLNQDTLFFDGAEKLAQRCNLPVYFVRSRRIARGRYELSFDQIYDGTEEVAENVITERYVRKLEEMICEHPELWIWSHRRWKHKKTDVNS